MFVYQPIFSILDVKQANNEAGEHNVKYNVSTWISKEIYNSGLKPLQDLTPIIKYFC